MDFIIEYWYIIFAAVAMGVVLALAVIHFFKLPTDEQLRKVREWLVYACTMAEQEFGGGTGQLKLRQVYDLFLARFPWLAKVVPFALFSSLVDDALVTVREMLAQNKAVKELVSGANQ